MSVKSTRSRGTMSLRNVSSSLEAAISAARNERETGKLPALATGRYRAAHMASPLIGVSTSITVSKSPERAYLNSAYLHALQQAGGIPVPLPPQLSPASLNRLVRGLDGLLLTGGGDIDPALFGEE